MYNLIQMKKIILFIFGFMVLMVLVGIFGGSSNKKNNQISPTPSPQAVEIQVPSPTPTSLDSLFTDTVVTNVIDGDTFTIEGGKVVRMIGMDTPETVHPSKPIQCYGKEASAKTTELIEGQKVRLEKDVSETDKYKRLLRYVWKGDVLINELLVKEGYAQSSSYPPDIKYQERFIVAQQDARDNQGGLWGLTCASIPTPTPKTTIAPPAQNADGSWACNCSKTCANMSCDEAQYQLNTCGCSRRDADGDGTACDSQCQ